MLLEVIARLANVRPTQKLSRLTKDFSDLIAKIYIFDNKLAWIRWKKRMAKKGQKIFFPKNAPRFVIRPAVHLNWKNRVIFWKYTLLLFWKKKNDQKIGSIKYM